jgi:hypothetical protein
MKMKKFLASLLCLLMVVAMALTMTACEKDKKSKKDDEDSIVGKWEWAGTGMAETGLLDGALGDDWGELEGYIDLSDVSLGFDFNFKKNGTVVMTMGDVDQTIDDLVDAYMEAMEAYCVDNGATFDEMLEEAGMTKSEMKKEIKALVEESMEGLRDIEETSYYELDGEDILTGDSEDDLTKEGTFDGDKIILELDGERITLVRAE